MNRHLTLYLLLLAVLLSGCGDSAPARNADAEFDALCHSLDLLVANSAHTDITLQVARVRRAHRNLSLDDYTRIYDIYENFKFDSAYRYSGLCLDIARRAGDVDLIHRWQLNRARILSTAALFDEAQAILDSIVPSQLSRDNLAQYYNRYCVLYLFKSQFAQGTPYQEQYNDSLQHYRTLVLATADSTSFLFKNTQANALCREGHVDEAIARMEQLLATLRPGTHDHAVVASTLAYYYSLTGDDARQRQLLAMSAMSDIKSNTMENSALRELSAILFARGDVDRAYTYLKRSIADANTYGTRLRNVQSAALIPHIVKVYEASQARQQQRITRLLYVMTALAVALLLAAVALWWLVRKTLRANRHVNEVNVKIREASGIKEQYLARFLALCSSFIEDAHDNWRAATKLMREGKTSQLRSFLTADAAYSRNTKAFHRNFDTAFLTIYPGFIEQVNRLLRTDEQIVVAADEKLSSDLRLLALIRLGITDNEQIASILRTSVNTIYTYRSRLRNRAIDKDSFEDAIKQIDTLH